MKNRLLFIAVLLPLALFFNACEKITPLPDVAQPIINRYSVKDTIVIAGSTIITGPLKDYEQDSEVNYKLTVTSNSILTKFFVTTTSDAVSKESRILRTEPQDAIDTSGNFLVSLNSVVVYYAFHIHANVPIGSSPVVTFNFQNVKIYTGTSSETFTVIKTGSTLGKRLTMINLPWAYRFKSGIGSQSGIDWLMGYRTSQSYPQRRGPFFSLEYAVDIWRSADAITAANHIDIVGYIPRAPRTNDPGIMYYQGSTNGPFWYFVSPSDTTLLTYTYAGAEVARIAFSGSGTGSQVNITVNGVTKTATYATSTTVTATNFVTANKAAYAAVGINLSNMTFSLTNGVPVASAVLSFQAINDLGGGFGTPTKTITVGTGTFYANDQLSTGLPDNPYMVSSYANGLEANIAMRYTIRTMAKSLSSQGNHLRKVYWKRLDNLPNTAPDYVSVGYYGLLTHDNEFDKLLGPTQTAAKTYGGPVGLNQVWGFVADDGKRGLIRTSPTSDYDDALKVGSAATMGNVPLPNSGSYVLFCQIKWSYK